MATITIRPYQRDDESALILVINEVCAEGMMATPRFEPTPAWRHALTSVGCDCHLLLVAEANGEIIGWCRIFPDVELCSGELAVGLRADYRGHGLGTGLVEQALAWAASTGLRQVWLSTWSANSAAVHLFHKFGFRPNGIWRGREQIMVLKLQ